MKTVIEQLSDFIEETEKGLKNLWIQDDKMQVYVRKGYHLLSGKASTTLDIATVEVYDEYRNKGLWTEFLKSAIELNPWSAVYVENVHNPYLASSLIRRGWITAGGSGVDLSFGVMSFFMPKDFGKYYDNMSLQASINKLKNNAYNL